MKKVYLLAAAGMLAALNANADTYYCSPTGAGDQSGDSWTNAYPASDLKEVVENLEPGDIVYLTEGTYTGGSKLVPTLGLTIQGGFPKTATGTDLSGYNPWIYKTILDAQKKNGGSPFIVIEGDDLKSLDTKNVIKGVTVTNAVGSVDAGTNYPGTALYTSYAYLELEDVTFDGNTSWCGGSTVFNNCSRVHAKHCVWSNNQNINTDVTTKQNYFQAIANARIDNKDGFTNVVFEGCSMYNNTIAESASAAVATYGGGFNMADGAYTYGTNTAFVNCTIDGCGTSIYQNGGMVRFGNKSTLNFLAFNTFFNYSTTHATECKGHIISFNGLTPFYLQGNIIVSSKTNTANDDKANNAIFIQGWNSVSMEGITSGGDNSIGGNIFNTYASNNCTIREQQTTDNWLADSQDKVFGSNKTTEKDGRYYILPTDAYMNVNLETALSNYNSFEMPDCFKWANVDLSVDMYGKKRAATTYRGAYDPNAGDASGIEDVYTASGKKLTVKALGNGNFAIDGAEGTATVYDMAGRVISRQNVENGMVSIADAANGIYIVRVSGASVKVAR